MPRARAAYAPGCWISSSRWTKPQWCAACVSIQLMLNEEGGGALVVVAHLRRARLAGVAPRSRLAGPAARLRPPFVLLQAPGYKDVHLLSGQRVTRAIDTPLYRIEVSETLSQSQGRHVQ
jgi:hypothetical protein